MKLFKVFVHVIKFIKVFINVAKDSSHIIKTVKVFNICMLFVDRYYKIEKGNPGQKNVSLTKKRATLNQKTGSFCKK